MLREEEDEGVLTHASKPVLSVGAMAYSSFIFIN